MQRQAPVMPLPDRLEEVFESLRDPADAALNPGFYGRLHHRIESSRPISVWSFAHTTAGPHMALVLVALTLLITGFAVIHETQDFDQEVDTNRLHRTVVPVAGSPDEQRDAVLENIAVYSRPTQ
jgi:hypothetical protein